VIFKLWFHTLQKIDIMFSLINKSHWKATRYYVTIAFFFCVHITNGQSRLFYSNTWVYTPGQDILRSSSLGGEDIDTLLMNEGEPREIEVDEANGRVYWISSLIGEEHCIKSSNLDGSDMKEVVTDIEGLSDIALDTINSKIYWSFKTDILNPSQISRADLDGGNIEVVLSNLAGNITFDLVSSEQRIYWVGTYGEFWRADVDGSNRVMLFSIDKSYCFGSIQVDADAGLIYWEDNCARNIQRSDFNGTNIEEVTPEIYYLKDFKIDPENDKLYWAEYYHICRMNLDGTGHDTLDSHSSKRNYSLTLSLGTNSVYWTQDDHINKCSLQGTENQILAYTTLYNWGWDLAIDYVEDHIYWAGNGGAIGRSGFDGTDSMRIIVDVNPQNIAIDNVERKIYYSWNGILYRSDMDGSDNVELITGKSIFGIALDMTEKKIYWAYGDGIRRANYDGSSVEYIISSEIGYPYPVKIDSHNRKLYWTSGGDSNSIRSANLDGANIVDIVSRSSDELKITAIAVDPGKDKIYWSTGRSQSSDPEAGVYRANLDGTDIETVINRGLNSCNGIALLTAPATTNLLSPIGNNSVEPSSISLIWEASYYAGTYHVQVSSNRDFSDLLFDIDGLSENKYLAETMDEGKYYWRVATQNKIEKSDWSSIDSFRVEVPTKLERIVHLKEDYAQISIFPNPTKTKFRVSFSLKNQEEVRINIYDQNGKLISNSYVGLIPADDYELELDATNLPEGLYLISVKSKSFRLHRKLVIHK